MLQGTLFTQNRKTYLIEGVLGKGTGGVVYKAVRILNDERNYVALKQQVYLENQEKLTLNTLKQHNLQNVVNILDLDSFQNAIIIIMDLADGNFRDFWKKSPILDVQEILHYFIQIVKGTYELHQLCLIHRDIKLENVVYVNNNNRMILKLCDTGLMRQQNGRKTIMVGTPYYMAPEQINQDIYNEKVDIWALGMVLFEMISKTTLLKGNSIQDVLTNVRNLNQNIIDNQIDKLFIQNMEYSKDIKILLKQMIKTEFQQRLSALDVLKELQKILSQKQIHYIKSDQFQDQIKEQIRQEILVELQLVKQEEQIKLQNQHKMGLEQLKIEINEFYQNQLNEEINKVVNKIQEDQKQLIQQEFKKLDEKYQAPQSQDLCREEKINLKNEIDKQFQKRIEEQIKLMKLEYSNKIVNEITIQQNRLDLMLQTQIQEQLKKQFQFEFEQWSLKIVELFQQSAKIQEGLIQSKMHLQTAIQQLTQQQQQNCSKEYKIHIDKDKLDLKQKIEQIEQLQIEIPQINVKSNQQLRYQIDFGLEKLLQIQQNQQDLINPIIVEKFIQIQNQKAQVIRENEQRKQQDEELIIIKEQLEQSNEQIIEIQKKFQQQKQILQIAYSDFENLSEKEKVVQEQLQNINQEIYTLNQELESVGRIIKTSKADRQHLDVVEKYNKQVLTIAGKLSQIEEKLFNLALKIQEQNLKDLQMMKNSLTESICKLNEWKQKIELIILQPESPEQKQLQQYIEEFKKQLAAQSQLSFKIQQLLNNVQSNKNSFKQFLQIKEEFEIQIYKIEELECLYKKEQKKIIFQQTIINEHNNYYSNFKHQLETIQQHLNQISQQFTNFSNTNNQISLSQNSSQDIVIRMNLLDQYKQHFKQIEILINNFGLAQFTSQGELKTEQNQIAIQIDQLSENLESLLNQLNEIKQQITQQIDDYIEQNIKSLRNQLQELHSESIALQLNPEENQIYFQLVNMKANLKKNISQNYEDCQKIIQENNLMTQFDDRKSNNNKQFSQMLEKFQNQKYRFKEWAEKQQNRIQQFEQEILEFEKNKMEDFFLQFINQTDYINSEIQNLQKNIQNLNQKNDKDIINKYNQQVAQIRNMIIKQSKFKTQNQEQFQNLHFYTYQIQILKFIHSLFLLECLHKRLLSYCEQQNQQQDRSAIKNASTIIKQQKLTDKLAFHSISIQLIVACLDNYFYNQNYFTKLNMFIRSINKYLQHFEKFECNQNDNYNKSLVYQSQIGQMNYYHEFENLHPKIEDAIKQLQTNINQSNKVKINAKLFQKSDCSKTTFENFGPHIPLTNQLKLYPCINQNLDQNMDQY